MLGALVLAALEGGVKLGSDRDVARAALLASGQEAALEDWLGERIAEVRKLETTVSELLVHPGGINHERFQRRDLAEHTFRDINSDVLRRLQREAPEWVDYYSTGPEWYSPGVSLVGEEAFRQLIRLLAYTADQLAHLKANVASDRGRHAESGGVAPDSDERRTLGEQEDASTRS